MSPSPAGMLLAVYLATPSLPVALAGDSDEPEPGRAAGGD